MSSLSDHNNQRLATLAALGLLVGYGSYALTKNYMKGKKEESE